MLLPLRLIAVLFLLPVSSLFAGEQYALLVGVSDYPNLDPKLKLSGPRNDVQLMHSLLIKRGFDEKNIQLLSDYDGATKPTKQAITNGMQSLQEKVNSGDFVYLHFSGHGSQQPAKSEDLSETDGLDEIFLPHDVSNWNASIGEVTNSITDDQIGGWVDALRDKGAFVWIVFDSCHSGTMTRSATNPDIKMRKVNPASLGIPELAAPPKFRGSNTQKQSEQSMDINQASEKPRGGLVAFFAAQSDEETPEMSLPRGARERNSYGLFTYTIAETLSRNPEISYQQLAQIVVSRYGSLPWRRTQPLFSGTDMKQKVLSDGTVDPRHNALLSNNDGGVTVKLSAGQLHGFNKGAIIGLFKSPLATEPFSLVEITSSTIATSRATGSEFPEKFPKRAYAQLAKPSIQYEYRVGWLDDKPSQRFGEMSDILESSDYLKRNIKWVGSGEAADIRLSADINHLYFFTQDDEIPCSILEQTGCTEKAAHQIRYIQMLNFAGVATKRYQNVLINGLTKMVRAQNLFRLSTALGTSTNRGNLSTKLTVDTKKGENLSYTSFSDPLSLHNGDKIAFELRNTNRRAVDVSVLFIDSAFGIYQLYPESGQPGRLFAGEHTTIEGEIESTTLGMEQFIVITTPVDKNTPPTYYGFLQQEPMAFTTELRSSRSRGSSDSLFAEAVGDIPVTRGFGKKKKQQAQASAQIIQWQTVEQTRKE